MVSAEIADSGFADHIDNFELNHLRLLMGSAEQNRAELQQSEQQLTQLRERASEMQAQINGHLAFLSAKYGLSPADQVNLEEGQIIRIPPVSSPVRT